jgi:hypothetical protein
MKTLVNPQSLPMRLSLSDGSVRVVPAWGIVVLPERGADGQPMRVVNQELMLAGHPAAESAQRVAANRAA